MKKLLFAVSALAALSLLAPSTGLAQFNNHLGLYADEAATSVNLTEVAAFSTVPVYVVVTNPYNTNLDQPVSGIKAVEFQVVPPANVTVLGITFTNTAVNVGTSINVIAGFGTPVDVSGGMAVVATYSILYMDAAGTAPAPFHLAPAEPASISDMLAIQDAADELLYGLYPSSSTYDNPVFGINTIGDDVVVATDEVTFDSVKALYR